MSLEQWAVVSAQILARRARPRRRVSAVGLESLVLLTLGVAALLYIAFRVTFG